MSGWRMNNEEDSILIWFREHFRSYHKVLDLSSFAKVLDILLTPSILHSQMDSLRVGEASNF